jgi:hypothetical protein
LLGLRWTARIIRIGGLLLLLLLLWIIHVCDYLVDDYWQ